MQHLAFLYVLDGQRKRETLIWFGKVAEHKIWKLNFNAFWLPFGGPRRKKQAKTNGYCAMLHKNCFIMFSLDEWSNILAGHLSASISKLRVD